MCSSVYIHLMDPKCRTFHPSEHYEYVLSAIQYKGDLFIRLRPWNRWYASHMLLMVRPNAFYEHTDLKSSVQHAVRQQIVSPTWNFWKIVTILMLHNNPPMACLMFWCKHIILSSCSLRITSDLWHNLMCKLNDTCRISRYKPRWRNSMEACFHRRQLQLYISHFWLYFSELWVYIPQFYSCLQS